MRVSLDERIRKKALLLQQAMCLDPSYDKKVETAQLAHPETFSITPESLPAYFQNAYKSMAQRPACKKKFFDYRPESHPNYWHDYAADDLGGGCFGTGMVQEEMMVHEFPPMAYHIAETRQRGGIHVRTIDGSPNPYLMKNMRRVQSVTVEAYGGHTGLPKISREDILRKTTILEQPQRAHIFASATRRLDSRNPVLQFAVYNLHETFNTLVAGFILVKEQEPHHCIIHSGKFGCGAFNQDYRAVYLLQRLAAGYVGGFDLTLHAYSQDEAPICEALWEKLEPQFQNQTLEECIKRISEELTRNIHL